MNLNPLKKLMGRRTAGNPVVTTTVDIMPGFGERGCKPNAFARDKATRSFSSWVYIAAMLNAKAFAGVPLRLYVRRRPGVKLFKSRPVNLHQKRYLNGGFSNRRIHPSKLVMQKIAEIGSDFEEVTSPHPALQLLSQVNPWQNGFELSTLRMLYLQMTGNAYVYPIIDPALGRPTELWPMASQWTSAIPSDNNLIGGYTYGRGRDLVEFQANEVMRWALPSITDPYYGFAPAQAVWDAIGISESKHAMDAALFQNMGRPDYMLLLKNGGSQENLDRIEAQVDTKLRGVKNAGRFLVAAGEVQAVQLNFTPAELGDQNRVIEEIAGGFGVPISKLLANDPNRANAETGDAGWMRDTILPYCRMDEETLNAAFLPLFGIGDDAVLAYDNPVPTNETLETTRVISMVTGNVIQVNEARAEMGYPPIANGDQLLAELTKPEPLANLFSTYGGGQTDNTDVAPATPAADDAAVPAVADVPAESSQATQLNGAQVTSFLDIVQAVTAGKLPRDAGLAMLQQLFRLTPDEATAAMGSAGRADVPTTPNPVPAVAPGEGTTAVAPAVQNAASPIAMKTDGPHAFGCVMASISGNAAAELIAFGESIPDALLADDGRETDPHVAVLYGLHTDEPDDIEELLTDEPPIRMMFGEVKIFEATELRPCDVVVLNVISDDLHRLNALLRKSLDYTSNYPDYVPHATVAYVKAGEGKAFAGTTPVSDSISVDRVEFSTAANKRFVIRLTGDPEKALRRGKAASTVNSTTTGKARELPDGAKLIPPLLRMFKAQRQAVLAQLAAKSLDQVEADYVTRVIAVDPNALGDCSGPAVHAYRRGVIKRQTAARLAKDSPETQRPDDAPPPPKLPSSFVPLDQWTKELSTECRPIIEAIMKEQGSALLTQVGASPEVFAAFEKNIPKAAQAATMQFCEATNDTTSMKLDAALSQLRDEVQVGLVSGETTDQITDRVQAIFDEAEEGRAERIARTESSRATHTGEIMSAQESGVVSRKKWLASADACPVCEQLAAIGAIPLTKSFAEFGGDYGTINTPPAHPFCVCSLTYEIED